MERRVSSGACPGVLTLGAVAFTMRQVAGAPAFRAPAV